MSEEAPKCPRCKGTMRAATSQHGPWWKCAHWPTCKGKRDGGQGAAAAEGVPLPRPAKPRPLGWYAGCLPLAYVPPGTLTLDTYQQAIVDTHSGEVITPAAAGSGKTTTLIERTAALLARGEAPEAILLVVFNRDAAETIRARLEARVGPGASRVNVYTFHAWCYAMLRHWYPDHVRLAHGRVLGTPGAPHPVKLIAPLLDELDLTEALSWRTALTASELGSEALLDVDARDAEKFVKVVQPNRDPAVLLRFLRAWRERKQRENVIQFSDMLGEVALAFTQHEEQLGYLKRIYRHVMVDEAQDISTARYVVACHLGLSTESLLWVGDPAQSVYLFAGAQPALVQRIAERARIMRMPVNRRSTRAIVDFSNAIVRGREWALGGDAEPKPDALPGEPVQVWVQATPAEEAGDVILDIQRRLEVGWTLGTTEDPTFCCVARTNAMLVEMESAFVGRGVPCQIDGCPGGIWGSTIGGEMLAYLEAVSGVATWNIAQVMNKPKRFANKDGLRKVLESCQARETAGLQPDLHKHLALSGNRGLARLGRELADLARESWAAQVNQCARWLGLGKSEDLEGGDEDRGAALEALVKLATGLGGLSEVYAYKKAQAQGERGGAVLLTTGHRSKGRQWPVVYVCGVRVGKLPHKRCDDAEEELRLLYVMCTRPQYTLIVSTGGKPSKFLVDLGLATWKDEA